MTGNSKQPLRMAGLTNSQKKNSMYVMSPPFSPQQKTYMGMGLYQHLGTPEAISIKM